MKNLTFNFKSIVQTKARWLLTFCALLTLGVGQMWATKRVWIDVTWNSGYADKMRVQYSTDDGVSWTVVTPTSWGTVNSKTIYYADIHDDATKWQVYRGDNENHTNDYNWQWQMTYSGANMYTVTEWNNSGTGSKVIGMVTGGYIYYDDHLSDWSGTANKYFVIGHDSYYGNTAITNTITNTKLWYIDNNSAAWPDAKYFAFIAHTSSYPSASKAWSDIDTHATHKTAQYTSDYNLVKDAHYLCIPSASGERKSFSINNKAAYTDLNYRITIKEKYNASGSTPWAEVSSSTTHGTITVEGYKFGSWTTCNTSSSATVTKETNTYSAYADFGYTNTVTLTAGATKAGKAFVGWYDSDGNQLSTNTSYDYLVTKAETIYAYYKDEVTNDITVSYKCGDDVIKTATTELAVGVTTTRSVTAPNIDHYEFVNWTYGDGVTVDDDDATTININSVGNGSNTYTLTANYKHLTRFYFVNSKGWSDVYAYIYYTDGDKIGNWPGEKITTKTKSFCGSTVYYFDYDASTHSTWTTIIFNDGSSGTGDRSAYQTSALTISGNADKVYVHNKDTWYNTDDHTVSVVSAASHMGTVSGGGTAKAYGCSAAISAEEKPGYRFNGWSVTSGTAVIADASSKSTTVTASTDATITASFTQNGIIYFDNTMSQWQGDIYVYFFTNAGKNPWWKDKNGNNGPGVVINEDGYGDLYAHYGKMTRIGSSNVYYYDYAAASLSGSSIEHVVFTKGDYHTSHGLYQTSAAFRSDFKNVYNCFPMYIASKNWTTTNETGYHDAGYWKRYNVTESGFWLIGLKDGNSDGDYWDRPEDELEFTSASPNSNTFKAKVHLNNATWNFRVTRCYGSDLANTGTMTASNHSGWEMTATGGDCHIEIPAGGDYEFTLNLGTDHIYLSVEYPLLEHDYHLLYTGRITTDGSDSHVHASQPIRHITKADTTVRDTVSFFIDAAHKGTLKLQRCTDPSTNSGKGTWADTLTIAFSDAISTTGIYNFEIVQTTNASGVRTASASILDSDHRKYNGPLYIRSDIADGGWEAYKEVENNQMIFSDYAKSHSNYDHYFVHWAETSKNLHFTIANDYSPSISDTMKYGPTSPFNFENLPYQASVRFMYDSETNILSRAYLNGSGESGEASYLILRCKGDSIRSTADKAIVNISGDLRDTIFSDLGNWVYQLDVKVLVGTHVRLISNYYFSGEAHHQYFKGNNAGTWTPASTEQIIGGSTEDSWQSLRLVYDFKTNNLVSAWMPPTEGNTPDLALYADVMILREEQKDARQITFATGNKLTEVDTVYAVMQFNKWSLNNRNKANTADSTRTQYARGLYWISFPFDVKLNDVFGFGSYGTHWIIEYYDGKERAQKGFWADSPGFWKYVYPSMRDTFTLKANEGYVLALDLDELIPSSKVWEYVENVYLYFPSAKKVGNIQTVVSKPITIDQNGYECTIGPRFEGGDDRTIKDSYWHLIGVPSYANATHGTSTPVPAMIESWTPETNLFFYAWDSEENTYSVYSSGNYNFKAMYSYMVQYRNTTLTWSNITNTVVPAGVAARVAETTDYNLKLSLLREDEEQDRTLLRMTNDVNATNRFEFNYDICKEYNGGRANIWTVTDDTVEVAGNCLPTSTQTTIVPVGVKVVANGDYTFSIPDGTSGMNVTLVDTYTGARTSLGLIDYTTYLTTGTHDGRFLLEIAPVQNVVTEIENVANANANANADVRKVLIDGRLYIVKDGKAYDAQGHRVE